MIYKFKSAATGDLIMLGPNGDQLLRLLGREPSPQGIFEPADMPALIATPSTVVGGAARMTASVDAASQGGLYVRPRATPSA